MISSRRFISESLSVVMFLVAQCLLLYYVSQYLEVVPNSCQMFAPFRFITHCIFIVAHSFTTFASFVLSQVAFYLFMVAHSCTMFASFDLSIVSSWLPIAGHCLIMIDLSQNVYYSRLTITAQPVLERLVA